MASRSEAFRQTPQVRLSKAQLDVEFAFRYEFRRRELHGLFVSAPMAASMLRSN